MRAAAVLEGVWPTVFQVGNFTTMVKKIAVTAASLLALVAVGYFVTLGVAKPISTSGIPSFGGLRIGCKLLIGGSLFVLHRG